MRASQHWEKGAKGKPVGSTRKAKKSKRPRGNQREDVCLNCTESKCNRGTCKKFKR